MITLISRDNKVIAQLNCGGMASKWWYHFTCQRQDEAEALLLLDNLNKELERRVKQLCKDHYERGWKDAKAKRKKETWFRGWF